MSTKSTHDSKADGATTHFGYKQVAEEEKASLVRDVFDNVSSKYDLMNDLMSLGVHRLWKNTMLDMLRPKPGMSLVDVGGGTGDIAFRFLDRGGRAVSVVDINNEMLTHGRRRAIDQGRLTGLNWINGDAEQLPLPSSSVDAFTIAFCIRNVTHIESALEEAARVLKPGGRFLCLEFSHVVLPVLERIYDTYSFSVLPWLGEFIANDRDSYRYLAESIRQFPDQDRFAQMIDDAGLEQVTHRNLSGGIAAIHSAWRL
jgi:demethylmenaquinone methyltransferase/2-methoxy-6-polyprenyl-1,4-benzoquinol methylase